MNIKSLFYKILSPENGTAAYPSDFSLEEIEMLKSVSDFTMTSIERQVSMIRAVHYIIENGIVGDFVECGVWKGGSSMLAALILLAKKESHRNIWLYDTFSGMTEPKDIDRDFTDEPASNLLQSQLERKMDSVIWAICSKESVQSNLHSTGYNPDNLKFIVGAVENTLPANRPEKIAFLRLDTDWYESTYHELKHLYPLLEPGGILIIDDYGHWKGAKKAVDQYFEEIKEPVFLNRIDMTGRLVVKPYEKGRS